MRGLTLLLLLGVLVAYSSANNITAYQDKVNQIFDLALQDDVGFERLSYLCNRFGPRITGSTNLENAINWIVAEMQNDGFDSVTTEDVTVPTVRAPRYPSRFHLISNFCGPVGAQRRIPSHELTL